LVFVEKNIIVAAKTSQISYIKMYDSPRKSYIKMYQQAVKSYIKM